MTTLCSPTLYPVTPHVLFHTIPASPATYIVVQQPIFCHFTLSSTLFCTNSPSSLPRHLTAPCLLIFLPCHPHPSTFILCLSCHIRKQRTVLSLILAKHTLPCHTLQRLSLLIPILCHPHPSTFILCRPWYTTKSPVFSYPGNTHPSKCSPCLSPLPLIFSILCHSHFFTFILCFPCHAT